MPVAVATIVRHALVGHSIYGSGEAIRPADAVYCLEQLNLILDDWNAQGRTSVAGVFTDFVTVGSLQPHTIGPTGTWVLPVAPVAIDGAALSVGTNLWAPITVHDDPQWWLARSFGASTSGTELYYAATSPNGSIYFAGVPGAGTTVRILTRTTLAALLATQTLALPAGYEQAMTLTLQEAIADAFHATVSATLERRAGKARATAFGNNLRVPTLSAGGQGLPGGAGGWWDYRTGEWR